jgi:hypothetical protein
MNLDIHQPHSSLAIAKCEYCSHGFHTKFECSRLHFTPLSTIVIARFNETKSSHHQPRRLSNRFLRRKKSEHVYVFKGLINSEEFKETESLGYNSERFNYLRGSIKSFGSKRKQQHFYNKSAARMLQRKSTFYNKATQDIDGDIMENIDGIYDFRHYFNHCNPERL